MSSGQHNIHNTASGEFENKTLSFHHELLTDDKTLLAKDHGRVFTIATDAKTITLPAASTGTKGMEVTIVNSGAAGNNIVTIASATADFIAGVITLAATVVVKGGTVDKDLINTKSTATLGDYVKLVCDGVDGWFIIGSSGIWASE